jgi:hypothetical protein
MYYNTKLLGKISLTLCWRLRLYSHHDFLRRVSTQSPEQSPPGNVHQIQHGGGERLLQAFQCSLCAILTADHAGPL